MGYEVYKSGKDGFRVIEVTYKNGTRSKRTVKKEAWAGLGFSQDMSRQQAKDHASQLNSESLFKREMNKKIVNIGDRLAKGKLVDSVFLPEPLVQAFEDHLKGLGYDPNDKLKGKIYSRWNTVQKLISDLSISPEKYAKNSIQIYRWMQKHEYSPDTAKKFIRVLNLWGEFVLDREEKVYASVKPPHGDLKQDIRDTYMDSDSYQGESDPLTSEMLKKIKKDLIVEGNYEWLFISIWFGLRPSEIDSLINSKNFEVKFDHENNVDVLWVYQSKLGNIDREKRWKLIPILFTEQEKALQYIREKSFKRPLLKTLQKHTSGYITLYGGRKGFQDLMCTIKNRSIYEVSQWLGHQSINMTLSRYKNRKRVALDKKAG